jgi:hypothetical protein
MMSEVIMSQFMISKPRQFFPNEEKSARFRASLSFPFGQGTMAAQPSNGFLHHTTGTTKSVLGIPLVTDLEMRTGNDLQV